MVQEGGGVAWTAPGEPEPCSLSRPSPRAPHMQVLDSPGLQQADDRRPSLESYAIQVQQNLEQKRNWMITKNREKVMLL